MVVRRAESHHLYLPLYGNEPIDVTVCVAATALGVTNGFARVAADRHYMSDVLAGAALGWGASFAMPVLLHYRWFRAPVDFDFAGGKLGVWLLDSNYGDNLAGEGDRNPKWKLTLLGDCVD